MTLAMIAWRRRQMPGAISFFLLAIAITDWAFFNALELLSPSLTLKIFWANLEYLGIMLAPVAWFAFILEYTGNDKWLVPRNLFILLFIPLLTILLVWTNDWHGLIRQNISLRLDGPFPVVGKTYGPWFWIATAFVYFLSVAAASILVQHHFRRPNIYRRQTIALFISVLIPWVGNLIYLTQLNPVPGLDWTPIAFTLSGVASAWAVFRYGFLDIAPIAHDIVFDNVPDGVIVVDLQNRVVDLNPAAQRLLDMPDSRVVGHAVQEVFSDRPDLVARYQSLPEVHEEIVDGEGATQRVFEITIAPLRNRQLVGHIIILRDITAHKHLERALKSSEQYARGIVDSSLDMIMATDTQRRIIEFNHAAEEAFGYSRAELLGSSVERLYAKPEESEAIRQAMLTEGTFKGEITNLKKNGDTFPSLLSASRLRGANGEILGVVGVSRDITKRKQNEEALRANERRYQILFQEAERQARNLELLHRVHTAISRDLDLPVIFRTVVEAISQTFGYTQVSLYLLEGDTLVLQHQVGYQHVFLRIPITQGVMARVVRTGKSILLPDVRTDPDFLGAIEGIVSQASVPLIDQERVIGALNVESTNGVALTQIDLQTLSALSEHVIAAIERARLYGSLEQQFIQLSTLRKIDRTLNSMLDLTPILETILTALEQIVPYDDAAILLLDGKILRAASARGRDQASLMKLTLDISENRVFQHMASTSTSIILNELSQSTDWVIAPGLEQAQSWVGTPLVARDQVIGQIGLFSNTSNAFTQAHADLLLAFANQAAIAIANARLREELGMQARRDSLTQLLNHGTFINELRIAYEIANKESTPLTLIMLDLDHFKIYNDNYGHVLGDSVLRGTAQAIQSHIKQSDLVGRWGGEEFAIGLRCANMVQAEQIAERIRATLAQMRLIDRQGHPIASPTASLGIATFPTLAKTMDELIEQADRALYRAKAHGRDQIARAGDIN